MKITPAMLEAEGLRAHVTHHRRPLAGVGNVGYATTAELKKLGYTPDPHGGFTIAELRNADTGEYITGGLARCSILDNFCRRTGWQIAVGRALRNFKEMTST